MHHLQRNSKLCCYHLKSKQTQDDSWFYRKQGQEMPLLTLPETVVYQGQVDKGKYCQDIIIKKKEFC